MGPAPKRVFPIGIGYIAGELLADDRFDASVIDFQLEGVTFETVRTELQSKPYEIIAIKAYAVDYDWFEILIAKIREEVGDSVKIISGGPLATFSYEVVLQKTAVDICIFGEAESSFMEAIDGFDDLSSVKGIAFLDEAGKVKKTPGGWLPTKDINDIAWPAYHIFDIEPYTQNRKPIHKGWEKVPDQSYRVMDIITARGCPFTCQFCGRLTKKYRKRTVDNVIKEMEFLIDQYDINFFAIEDELFLYQKDWIYEFCEKVKPLNITWRCQSRAMGMKADVLKLMREAGCLRITMGVESGSRKILNQMVKKISPETIAESVTLCREAGIYPETELILGTPGETAETVEETLDLWRKLNLPPKQMGLLQCYPGTPYFNEYVNGPEIGDHEKVLYDLSYGDGTLSTLPHNISGLPDEELIRLKAYGEAEMQKSYRAELDCVYEYEMKPLAS